MHEEEDTKRKKENSHKKAQKGTKGEEDRCPPMPNF